MLTTLLAFLVVIGVLVFVHELGHLVAAKSVDIECPRFSIGFGPRVLGFKWGETEYVISALPLGGYVRMAGMEDTAALEGGEEPERAPSSRDFDAKPLWARIWVVSAGVLMNFLFAILVIAAVGAVWGEPVNPSTRVAVSEAEATGAAAPLARVPVGAEITGVNDRPVQSWNELAEELQSAPAGPVTLRFANAAPVTLQLPAEEAARQQVLRPLQPFVVPVIGEVSPSSPAARAGLQADDRIVSVAGAPILSWTHFVEVVRASPGRPLALEVERGGQRRSLSVTPEAKEERTEDGKEIRVGMLGIAPHVEVQYQPLGPVQAMRRGVEVTWATSLTIVELLGDLFTGDASPRSLGGPLAIGQMSGQAMRGGLEMMLQWMAVLSVNLAVLNLLPIPVLDGGQLLFLLIEGLRGRPLSVEQRLRLSHVGLILVVGLMVWAITNDFLRLFGI